MKAENALPDFDGDNKDQRSWTHWMAEWLYDVRKACKAGAPICLFIDWRQYPSITDALHYLLKPVNGSRFSLCMDKALSRLNHLREKTVSIKTPCSTRIVPIHNILYAERVKRSICYYLNDGTTINSVSSCGTFLHAAAPLLAYSSFLAVGSSFVVNLYHVTEVTKSDMLLTGGYLVPVPRRTYETVKSKWADYWLDKGDIHVI